MLYNIYNYIYIERERFPIPWFISQMPAEKKSGFQNSLWVSQVDVRGSKYLSYHPLPLWVHTGRKLDSEAELKIELRHSDMGCRDHKWYLAVPSVCSIDFYF